MPNCNALFVNLRTKQTNNKDVAISTILDENTNIYPPTFVVVSFGAVELIM